MIMIIIDWLKISAHFSCQMHQFFISLNEILH